MKVSTGSMGAPLFLSFRYVVIFASIFTRFKTATKAHMCTASWVSNVLVFADLHVTWCSDASG